MTDKRYLEDALEKVILKITVLLLSDDFSLCLPLEVGAIMYFTQKIYMFQSQSESHKLF